MASMKMTKDAALYFSIGCGRCELGGTPHCKVHTHSEVLHTLRGYLLQSGLKEESKWGAPCYTHQGKNVVLLGAFKDVAFISFLKGVLLKDEYGILVPPGKESQSARLMKFTDLSSLRATEHLIPAYLSEAIAIEARGEKVQTRSMGEYEYPEELKRYFEEHPLHEKCFRALTPGRQRGYLLFFAQPRQAVTRLRRIQKSIPDILAGRGLHDGYK
jgi:uncharacterized protein YdeI (YjbR/CyaY-like superfamily)